MNEQALQKIEPEQPSNLVAAPIEGKTPQQTRVEEVAEALLPAYQKASELRLTDKEGEALREPFRDDQVEIRPHDGLLYIPHIHVSDRLIRVLGAGQWAMVRRREWIESNRIYAEYVMKVRGCFVGESVGCMDYHPSNSKMNYSDALEGTRGECIRRIAAKDLGCGSQVWNPEYCRQWIAKYAEQSKGRWQRKGVGVGLLDTQSAPSAPSSANAKATTKPPPNPDAPATEDQRIRWIKQLQPIRDKAEAYGYDQGILRPPDENDPGEPLECWPLNHTPSTKWAAEKLFARIQEFIANASEQSNATQVTPKSPENTVSRDSSEASKRAISHPETKSGHSGGDPDSPENQPWFGAIVPVPYKGQKRDAYLKKPDTIGELYNLRHDDDQARRRLFGFVHNFEPKGWAGRDGKPRPPSDADKKFRDDLDQFFDWFEANHPDELAERQERSSDDSDGVPF